MGEVVIAVTGEGEARWYGLGEKGVGHVVMTGQDSHGDPLSFGATMHKPCGGKELDAARLVEKFDGDAKCTRCVKWLSSATGISELDAARVSYWTWENGSDALADVMGAHTLITLDGVTEVPAPDVREDAAPAVDPAAADAFVAALFAPELGIDGKPWVPGDNPARRVPENVPAPGESLPLIVPRIVTGDDVREDAAPAPYFDQVTGKADPVTKRAAAIKAERERLTRQKAARKAKGAAKGADTRENSAPTLPGVDVVASTGKTVAVMIAETTAYYANGGTVSAEIAGLPDPSAPVADRQWTAAKEGTDAGVLVCEFKGAVSVINMERTHGKCPGCTTYIPLLPEAENAGPVKPKSSGVKCKGVGEIPVPGSRVAREDHSISLPDDVDAKHSGTCPGCDRIIAVSREGGMRNHHGVIVPDVAEGESADRIGTHNVGGVATPVVKGRLKDKAVELVEHGSVPGDPGDANARRAEETRCPKSRKTLKDRETPGKVECPNEECGRTVELKARQNKDGVSYVIPEHTLRGRVTMADTDGTEKLDPSARVFRNDGRNVTPFGTGADAGKGQRDHGSVDGCAIVSQSNMAPVQPGGWLGHAGTGQLPAGLKSGIDPTVSGEWCPICKDLKEIAHLGKSKGWRRDHSRLVGAYMRGREEKREAKKVAEIKSGEAIPQRVRKALRKAAAVGSFSEGVNAHSGIVTHAARPVGRLGTGAYSPAK